MKNSLNKNGTSVYFEGFIDDREFAAEINIIEFCGEFNALEVEAVESTEGVTFEEVERWAATEAGEKQVLAKMWKNLAAA